MRRQTLALLAAAAAASLCVPFVSWAQPAPPPAAPAEPASAKPPTEPPRDAATEKDDDEIISESRKWLALVDDGKAGAAWDGASPQLRASVSRDKWIAGIRAIRKPYGKPVKRQREELARAHRLPGVPEGDYAVVQFDTTFANGKHATELVTWSLNDLSWRVSGYQIR